MKAKNANTNMMRLAAVIVLVTTMSAINLTNVAFAASPGALDSSFDVDGKVIATNGGGDGGNDVAIQPDGKIVIVGERGAVGSDFSIFRYHPDGSLDTTFDTDGKVTTDFGNTDEAFGVAIQSDGKIVAVGQNSPGAPANFAIARYNPNGSLDTSFDTDGKVITDLAGVDKADSVAIQLDGRIIVGGTTSVDFALARYNTDGSLDTTFDTDGKQTVDFGGTDIGSEIALQEDGKIVIAGQAGTDFAVARLDTVGSLDTSFDTDGKVTTDISGTDDANSVAIQTDGKIVAAGGTDNNVNCALARYNTNGSLDTSFDGDGKVITNFAGTDNIQDISIQANGKTVAAIFGQSSNGLGLISAARYNPNGSLDTSFGTGGIVSVGVLFSIFNPAQFVNAMALSADGKIVVIGDNNAIISMIRLNANIQPTAPSDFDGDGVTDFAVFRPAEGAWYVQNSGSGTFSSAFFGQNGDIPVDGDFDGDGRSDIAVFRPAIGSWFILNSSNGQFSGVQFGQSTDKPVPGDYDKDGKTDIAVFRPSTGFWYHLRSSDGTFQSAQWGQNLDMPIPASAQ